MQDLLSQDRRFSPASWPLSQQPLPSAAQSLPSVGISGSSSCHAIGIRVKFTYLSRMNLLLDVYLVLILLNVLVQPVLHLAALLLQQLYLLLQELDPLCLLVKLNLLVLKQQVHGLVVALELILVPEVLNELLDLADLDRADHVVHVLHA